MKIIIIVLEVQSPRIVLTATMEEKNFLEIMNSYFVEVKVQFIKDSSMRLNVDSQMYRGVNRENPERKQEEEP